MPLRTVLRDGIHNLVLPKQKEISVFFGCTPSLTHKDMIGLKGKIKQKHTQSATVHSSLFSSMHGFLIIIFKKTKHIESEDLLAYKLERSTSLCHEGSTILNNKTCRAHQVPLSNSMIWHINVAQCNNMSSAPSSICWDKNIKFSLNHTITLGVQWELVQTPQWFFFPGGFCFSSYFK